MQPIKRLPRPWQALAFSRSRVWAFCAPHLAHLVRCIAQARQLRGRPVRARTAGDGRCRWLRFNSRVVIHWLGGVPAVWVFPCASSQSRASLSASKMLAVRPKSAATFIPNFPAPICSGRATTATITEPLASRAHSSAIRKRSSTVGEIEGERAVRSTKRFGMFLHRQNAIACVIAATASTSEVISGERNRQNPSAASRWCAICIARCRVARLLLRKSLQQTAGQGDCQWNTRGFRQTDDAPHECRGPDALEVPLIESWPHPRFAWHRLFAHPAHRPAFAFANRHVRRAERELQPSSARPTHAPAAAIGWLAGGTLKLLAKQRAGVSISIRPKRGIVGCAFDCTAAQTRRKRRIYRTLGRSPCRIGSFRSDHRGFSVARGGCRRMSVRLSSRARRGFAGGAPIDAANFGCSQNCADVPLAAGGSCKSTYTFTQTTLGAHSSSNRHQLRKLLDHDVGDGHRCRPELAWLDRLLVRSRDWRPGSRSRGESGFVIGNGVGFP